MTGSLLGEILRGKLVRAEQRIRELETTVEVLECECTTLHQIAERLHYKVGCLVREYPVSDWRFSVCASDPDRPYCDVTVVERQAPDGTWRGAICEQCKAAYAARWNTQRKDAA